MDETFGNAIIGKSKLGYSADVKILNVDGFETRSACRHFFENGANWNFAVINVHLDEKHENVRMAQVKKLLEWLSEKSNFCPYLTFFVVTLIPCLLGHQNVRDSDQFLN